MDAKLYSAYIRILEQELVPAMGCTEPIAVAYASAMAARELPGRPQKVHICVSSNIIKNVKSVIVPNTDGLHGLEAAAAAGIIAGQPDKKLLVISEVTDAQKKEIAAYLQQAEFVVEESDSGELFDICIQLSMAGHKSLCRIAGDHTNVVRIERNGKPALEKEILAAAQDDADKELLTIEDIVTFAENVDISDMDFTTGHFKRGVK